MTVKQQWGFVGIVVLILGGGLLAATRIFGDELFRKIDLDGDGMISLAEAEKADALFRKSEKDR